MEDLPASAPLIAGVSPNSIKSSYPENDTESDKVSTSNNEDDTGASHIVSTDPLPANAVAKDPLHMCVEEKGQKVEGEAEEKIEDKIEESSEKESGENNDGKSEEKKEKSKQKEFWGADFGTEVVYIFVGLEPKECCIHKDLICSSSPYFDKAFNGSFAEAVSSELHLEDETSETFSAFKEFLYTEDGAASVDDFSTSQLIDLYIFADKIQNDALKNMTMDYLQDNLKLTKKVLGIGQIRRIFSNTANPTTAPLRKFCGALIAYQIFCQKTDPEKIQRYFQKIPDLVLEFVKVQRMMSEKEFKLNEDPRHRHGHDGRGNARMCDFHTHEQKGQACGSISNCHEYCRMPRDYDEFWEDDDDYSDGYSSERYFHD